MSIQKIVWLVLGSIIAVASNLPAQTHIDVSSVIDKTAAESMLGGPVKTPTPRNVEGTDGYYSKCNYYSVAPGKLLILRVYQAAPGFDAKKELDQVRASSGLTKSISGLGDKAELSSGAASGLSANVTMLSVLKGNTLITVGLRGLDEDEAVERVKGVAEKILARL
jgi:phosphotransferase system HPr-like phosphotransfer protein